MKVILCYWWSESINVASLINLITPYFDSKYSTGLNFQPLILIPIEEDEMRNNLAHLTHDVPVDVKQRKSYTFQTGS